MKSYTVIALVLINLGIAAIANQGISYTKTENIINHGSIWMTADNIRTLPLPLIVGGISLVAGIALLLIGRNKV